YTTLFRSERGTTKMHKKERGTSRVGPSPSPGRQTDLFRKMSNAKAPGEGGRARGGGEKQAQGSNTGMIVAIVAAVVVIIGGAAFALMGKGDHKEGGSKPASPEAGATKKKKKEEPKPRPMASQPVAAVDNSVFRPGARGMIDKMTTPTMPNLTQDGRTAYEALVS